MRTIERDIGALQQAGIPIYADVGRRGGYALDKTMSLPPLNFTPSEIVALAVALERSRGAPFEAAGRSALRKMMAAISERNAIATRDLAARVRLLDPPEQQQVPEIPSIIERAIEAGRAVRIGYLDRFGATSEREVEPMALLDGPNGWYIVAWCHLRGESRCFRLDRIRTATMTDLPIVDRTVDGHISDADGRRLRLRLVGL